MALKLTPFDLQKVKPYFVVGGGIMNASLDVSASIPGASASSSDDETDICGKVGLGVDYFITDNIAIGLEGAYWAGFNDLEEIRFYTVTAGVAYHF